MDACTLSPIRSTSEQMAKIPAVEWREEWVVGTCTRTYAQAQNILKINWQHCAHRNFYCDEINLATDLF